MTGVKVMQGVLESAAADFSVGEEGQAWAVGFTFKQEKNTSKDLEGRDVYVHNLSLSLSPVEGRQSVVEETEMEFSSRFVSKELKSAATDVQASLTVSGPNTVAQFTFEGASRKKWEPEKITAPRVSMAELSEAELSGLTAEAAVKALALFSQYAVWPE